MTSFRPKLAAHIFVACLVAPAVAAKDSLPLCRTPGGRPVKHPRAGAKTWKTRGGRHRLWFHSNGTHRFGAGPAAGSRSLACLRARTLKDGRLQLAP